MDLLTVIIAIIVLGLIGVIVYLMVDYFKYKETTDKSLITGAARDSIEAAERKSNVKFVVDKLNTTANALSSDMKTVQKNNEAIVSSINELANFSEAGERNAVGGPKTRGILDMPGMSNPDINLMKRVSMVGGLTARGLELADRNVKLCNADQTRCTQFPDAKGDTFITTMRSGNNVVIDEMLIANKGIFVGPATGGNAILGATNIDGDGAVMHIVNGTVGAIISSSNGVIAHNVAVANGIDAPLINIYDLENSEKKASITVNKDGELTIYGADKTKSFVMNSATGAVTINGDLIVKGSVTSAAAPAPTTVAPVAPATSTTV